ncbi:ABC transporter substrate-binding protein [Aerococcus christensenii]|uniref:ABC transporter substrate-binding protein n=1 Tax=Aerococcus christensenii TaxID=87541 RepID=A0A109RC23_9LACT|nr:extracellular solute-binding protein [Aerococcus christensenii]AMB92021.1 hypothetical protein AWM71_01070 [Aerococcus christensenii]KXB36488.1 ABC transporter, solute-binding protein [Aerococcus christensenii]MDK8234253.1 extracellular solute-binding protein [Aerococcus christensenii]PKY91148.1 ABC transporter substrate-binding protein [Aerococcus christensenii]
MKFNGQAMKVITLVGALTLGLAGCGSSESKPKEEAKKDDSELVVYSNSLNDGRDTWLKEQAEKKGFKLKFVAAPGGEVYNRLLAEKNAPQADVTYGMDEGYFNKLKAQDLLEKYEPAWSKDVPKDYQKGEGYFSPLVEQRIYLMYNPKFVKAEDAPKSWDELINNEKYAKKYRLSKAISGGTDQKAAMSILFNYRDDKSENGISEAGWKQLHKFYEHGYMPSKGEDYVQLFAEGKVPIMYFFSSAVPKSEKKFNFKSEPINPEQGVFSVSEQIGLVKKGKDHDYKKAKAFIDWFGSAEVQKEWAKKFGTWPVLPKAQEGADDRLREIMSKTTPMKVDWKFVNDHIDSWVEKIELEILS